MPSLPQSRIAVVNSLEGEAPIPGTVTSSHGTSTEVDIDEATYVAQRRGLIAEEKQKRFDATRRAARTEEERMADGVVRKLRKQELRDIYDRPDDLGIIRGSSWARAKARGVQDGTLYKLITRMPKGAILHCHMDATVDANWLIKQSYDEPNLYMRAEKPLTTHASLYSTQATFRLLPEKEGTEADGGLRRAAPGCDDIYSPTYQPDTWVRLSKARQTFPYDNIYAKPIPGYERDLQSFNVPPQPERPAQAIAFDAYLFSKMTLTPVPETLTSPILTAKEAWAFFAQTFAITEGLQTHVIRYEYYLRSFQTMIADNISYAEVRINFFDEVFIGHDGQKSLTHAGLIEVFERALNTIKAELPSGRSFDAKVIYSTLRFIDGDRLQWYIDDAIAMKQTFPDRIIGFDLVGHEDVGITLHDYLPQLLSMRKRVKELGLDLPFCFHAGETLGDGDAIDDNLYDALLLGSRRLGHAFSLSRHPVLVEAVRQKNICIESCPISNQVLRYNDTQAVHPVLTLLAYGCPVVLSNDDPCQFLNLGLSPDFYSILIASDHFDLTSLAVLARNSLEHSLIFDQAQKQAAIMAWEQEFSEFVKQVAAMAD